MENPLFLQLNVRDTIPDDEKALLLGSFLEERLVSADKDIVAEGDRPTTSQLLLDGFAARYKLLDDGSRQITALHVPGDFMDLHGFLLKRLAHGVAALSDCRLALIEHSALRMISEKAPHLTRMLWLDTLIDGSIHREWIVTMGRMSTEAQIAHLVCELFFRLRIVQRTQGYSFNFPLTQAELADVLGLSIVHVNRTLQALRKKDLIVWDGSLITIKNWEVLRELGEFDPTYLCLENEPR